MNYSVQSNYTNMCRTCLIENANMKSVFSVENVLEHHVSLSEMLMSCASILVVQGDGLPENVCLSCLQQINNAFLFRKLSEKSDTTLRECYNTFTTLAPVPSGNSSFTLPVYESKYELDINVENENTVNNIKNASKCEEYIKDSPCDFDDDSFHELDETPNGTEESKEVVDNLITEEDITSKLYSCNKCTSLQLDSKSYRLHMTEVHGETFICDNCGKKFKSKTRLSRHIVLVHSNTSEEFEDVKPKTRRKKTDIIKKRNQPRTCDICGKTFRFHSNLERHKLIHTGEKPYLCNVCGKGFAQLSYLKIHSFIHTGEKPYKCQMCEKSFAAPGTLMTHVRTHTGERPHVCKICGKDFPQSGYLSAHIRTHTGEKPVECKVCHRRFNQSGRLIIHMRIHSGEKPYQCKECGRSFAVKGTLKKHIRTHTGERPYICVICGQSFAQSGTLATHMKVHKTKQ